MSEHSERTTKYLVLVLIAMMIITFGVSIGGLISAVLFSRVPFEGFLWVVGFAVAEPIAIISLWSRNVLGLRNPSGRAMIFNTNQQINDYMKKLIASGSTVDIVSGRLSWVSGDESVKREIIEHAKTADVRIFLPAANDIAKVLHSNGVNIQTRPALAGGPRARFTLVNKHRPGSAMLAVGYGNTPRFEIAEFPESRFPQLVALARDYVSVLSEERND